MRKLTVFLFSLLFLFTGCSNGDWEVTIKTTPFYKEGVAAPFAVQIKENGKLAKQLIFRTLVGRNKRIFYSVF
ncbi:hypothetical protein [Anoxybacillus flavithermus]|uniref:hypothetical protein n=1 Tax=Anoxybacillus flavithermus TaxID=33934 RepID=UPI001867F348|nr:hypothetical protein [Anoxybacillus flavithermus]MBE2926967.1 hypothetical protein [Anoxybacillus flavithermus]MBE2946337.1 hypothetical protein [Anoxybacillus flavithermus]MBE2949129.1 hypothetical protein [Anoxybacillus flavithermus]